MNETFIVVAIVALATAHVAYRYLPRPWLAKLLSSTASPPKDEAGCATGCSNCNGCGAGQLSSNRAKK